MISEGVTIVDDEEPGVKLGKLLHTTDTMLFMQTSNDMVKVYNKAEIALDSDTDKVLVGKQVKLTVDPQKKRSVIASMEREKGGFER